MGPKLLRVLRGSLLSVVGGHLGTVGSSAYLVSGFIRIERTGMMNAYGNVAIRDWNSSDRLQVTARPLRSPDLRARVLMHSVAFSNHWLLLSGAYNVRRLAKRDEQKDRDNEQSLSGIDPLFSNTIGLDQALDKLRVLIWFTQRHNTNIAPCPTQSTPQAFHPNEPSHWLLFRRTSHMSCTFWKRGTNP